MPYELNPRDPRGLWQSQEEENVTISLPDIRRLAARFERRIWWRNLREYVAGAVVIGIFAIRLRLLDGWDRLPAVLVIAGASYVLVQIHRRGSARPVPADAGARASIQFHRLKLERQRDALRTVWRWYLLPLVPGLAATFAEAALKRGVNATLIGSIVLGTVLFVGIWALNRWGARKLDRKIQELQAMEGGNE
jgi:hypothetical protein